MFLSYIRNNMTRTIEGLEIKIGDNFLAWSMTYKQCSLSLLKIVPKLKYLHFKAHILTQESSARFPAVAPNECKIAKSANTDVSVAAVVTLDTPDGTLNVHRNLEKLILMWGIPRLISASITAIKTTTVGLFPLLCTPDFIGCLYRNEYLSAFFSTCDSKTNNKEYKWLESNMKRTIILTKIFCGYAYSWVKIVYDI